MNKLYSESAVQAIADKIRENLDTEDTYTIAEMPDAIQEAIDAHSGGNIALVTDGELVNADDVPILNLTVDGNYHQDISTGKNIMPNEMTTQTLYGVTFTVNKDKTINIRGTATSRAEPNLYNNSSKPITLRSGVTYYNNSGTTIYMYAGSYITIANNSSYTPISNLSVTRFYIRVESGETVDTILYPMITTESGDVPYEPYTGGTPAPYNVDVIGSASAKLSAEGQTPITTQISLQDNFIAKLPNAVKDELIVDKSGDVYLKKKIGKVVLNGSESGWFKSGESRVDRYFIDMPLAKYAVQSSALSNNFAYEHLSISVGRFYLTIYETTQVERLFINYATTGSSTLTGFKQWLSAHNTEVYYELANPTMVYLGNVNITPFEGDNTLEIISNLEPSGTTTVYYTK